MASKAELTTQFIIEKVAPVFNKLGYEATSMSDITNITGLTKGAIYGNFENKEHLAIEAFNYNIRQVVWKIADDINRVDSASEKLAAITAFYRKYYNRTIEFGGCPMLNVGIDANHMNSMLHERVVTILKKLQTSIAEIIQKGVEDGEFREGLNSEQLGARIISQIEGAIYTSIMLKEPNHIADMMDFLDEWFERDLKR